MKTTAFILYSHSDYDDAWKIFVAQAAKHFGEDIGKYFFVDHGAVVPTYITDLGYKICRYGEGKSYPDRILECLEDVKEENILLHHEDMFLNGPVDIEKLKEYIEIMERDDVDFVKLIKGGVKREVPYKDSGDLFEIPLDSEYIFVIQPSIFKKSFLQRLYARFRDKSIWQLETDTRAWCREQRVKALYCFRNGVQKGKSHYDSDIYPFIATAIVKGKWNCREYGPELDKLFKEYGIDYGRRKFLW